MKVGQIIYLEPINNNARYSKEVEKCKISKIGRKYFELEKKQYGRFFIDSMTQDCGDYVSGYNAYFSLQEIEDKKEAQKIFSEIKKELNGFNTNIPLIKLKEILQIIKST